MTKGQFRGSFDRAVRSEPLARRGGDELWVFNGRCWGEWPMGGSRQRGDTVEDCDRRWKRGWAGEAL